MSSIVNHHTLAAETLIGESANRHSWLDARCEPDFLVPVQYNDLIRRRSHIEGEVRLVFAVLEEAMRSYVKNVHATRRSERSEFEEVLRWFQDQGGLQNPFSFEYVCDVLGVDPRSLRSQLPLLRREDLPNKHMRALGRRGRMGSARHQAARRKALSSRA